MPPLGRSFLACAVGLLAAASPARAYDSEEHKLIADWGASMVRLPPSIALPFPTRFHDTTLAARQKVYMDAKYLACGFRSNKQSDYNEDVQKVQDHSYWYGYAQLAGNKKLWIPPDSVLRETTLVVGTRLNTGQAVGFTIGELVSIYGDYRRTVYCATGDCYLTDANYARLHFDEGWDCFGPLNCGWRPPDVSMYEYLRDVGSGLWPPYGTCGNASGNTAADDQYYDAGWWGDEMIRIAGTNDWHFSSAAIAWYVGMHRLALIYVDRARTDPRFWNHALHYEANGLHSLTDLFAFGHIVANRDRTSHAAMVSSGVTGKKAYLWMEHAIDVGGGTR
ncbi:MAG TPA: hypothetical protein VN896_06945, partial [Methylomirabilota bacterium]|nr:hypothetical protein [Methylomirabilota bacterium]